MQPNFNIKKNVLLCVDIACLTVYLAGFYMYALLYLESISGA